MVEQVHVAPTFLIVQQEEADTSEVFCGNLYCANQDEEERLRPQQAVCSYELTGPASADDSSAS